jgi:hypothetical protein
VKLNVGLLWLKLHSTRRGLFFTSTFNLELRKKVVKSYIWSIAFYGAETWTLQPADQNIWKVWNVMLEKDGKDQLD